LAFFFVGEYTHMITTSFLMVILFFGGWHFPGIAGPESHWIFKLILMAGKVTLFILFYMLIRWTLPRFRFDQLMSLAWKVLIPLALANLIAVMVVMEMKWPLWLLLPSSVGILVGMTALTLLPADTRGIRKAHPAA
ncbi:MAG: NADH-quinone oxidoreductase subunit H, partial [Phycisphaerales bacterium]|nr:NADH-quinone oxidoreductase subunit H [Phycisphaerales bacterium]